MSGPEERNQPVDIDVERTRAVTITFADGYEASFDIMRLRMACPCAECRGLRERGVEVWPRPSSPTPLAITDARLHGAYGLNVTWNDTHATGIYPFDSLRRWSEGGRLFGRDSGLGGAPE